MKEPRSLGVRLALTILPVILLVIASSKLLVPGLDEGEVHRLLRSEPLGAALNLSVFAVGVMPFVEAYFVVELVALAVPRWRRLRHGNPEGRVKLERAARGLGLVLAGFQAFGIARWLSALAFTDVLSSTAPTISEPLVVASLVGGACIAMLVADLVTRQRVVNGLLLLSAIDLLVRNVGSAREAYAKATVAGVWEPRHGSIVIGATVLVLVAGWIAVRGANERGTAANDDGGTTAYRDAASLVVHPRLPVPSSTIAPYTIAASVLMLPATLATFHLPTKELAGALQRGPAWYVAFVPLVGALAFLLTRLLHRPTELEDLARRLGATVDRTVLVAAQNRALLPTLAFFAVVLVASEASGRVPFHRASLATLPVVAALLVDALHAVRGPSAFVGIWQERRAAAVPVIRAALEARGIATHASGAATHAMLQAFAPYAPVTIHVAAADAERATKILRHLLLGDEAPPREPQAPQASAPNAPRWTMRTRLVALGGALLVACGLLAGSLVKSPAPPPRHIAKLELFAVADTYDVFRRVPDADVPPDVEIRSENAPAGVDERGMRKTAQVHFASVRLQKGETIADAVRRGRAFTDRIELPKDLRIAWERTSEFDPESGVETVIGARTFVLEGESLLSNADVVDAMPSVTTGAGAPNVYVAISLTPEAGERFRLLTRKRINQRIAIVLDGLVSSAPVVLQEIGGGRMSITMGAGDPEKQQKEAQDLARGLAQH